MSVIVHSKPSCVQCVATYRALDRKGMEYSVVDISTDGVALARVRALGYLQAPVVLVFDDDGALVEHWSGFRDARIAALAAKEVT